ncbi:trypsin-like peptidase domain-containing protein [Chlorobium sp.]|uniref:trypsin-like peptidase domain-containing protein n=1 Tax=Chlorobium sp. TaxID=1095 RepID=UPI002F404894
MDTVISSIIPLLGSVRESLMSRKNVVATGIGFKTTAGKQTGELSIVCSVERKEPESKLLSRDLLPKSVDGIPTDVRATGRIRAFQPPTGRFRPSPGGVSIGHYEITAGTLGCLVRKNGELFILSNNHVLSNSNDASIGDAILQPGPYDGGMNPADKIAELAEFVPITYSGSSSSCPVANSIADVCNFLASVTGSDTRLQAVSVQGADNLVDAALARPINQEELLNDILGFGAIAGTAEGTLGMAVKKSGRTTGLTTGEIQQIDVTVNVSYGAGRVAQFRDQLLAGAMSQGGDSGSAVLDNSNNLVGLLFAGSDETTVINRIQNVFGLLGVTL